MEALTPVRAALRPYGMNSVAIPLQVSLLNVTLPSDRSVSNHHTSLRRSFGTRLQLDRLP